MNSCIYIYTSVVDCSLATAIMCYSAKQICIIGQDEGGQQRRDFGGNLHSKKSGVQGSNMRGLASKQVVDEEIRELEDGKCSKPSKGEGF